MQGDIFASLSAKISSLLADWLRPGEAVAHIGFPSHWNTGDSAIWVATQQLLRRLDCPVVYQCSHADHDPAVLARRIGGGTILLTGGGNLGDLWDSEQHLRERILADFPNNPVIQLPQSVHFESEANLLRFQRLCDAHRDYRIILRDQASYDYGCRHFNAACHLAPDMVFCLERSAVAPPPQGEAMPILCMMRADKEAALSDTVPATPDCLHLDWHRPTAGEQEIWGAIGALEAHIEQQRSRALSHPDDPEGLAALDRAYEDVAAYRLRRGLAILQRGRVLITDRLHGHILALHQGIPHVLLDNSYHKVRGTYDTWTRNSSLCEWADSATEALVMAQRISTRLPDGTAPQASQAR